MDTFTPTAALRQQMDALEEALARLARLLGQLELLEAHVYPLPAVPQGEEHDPIKAIEVGYLSGEAALAAAVTAFQDHSARPGCSTKATHRLPGGCASPPTAPPRRSRCSMRSTATSSPSRPWCRPPAGETRSSSWCTAHCPGHHPAGLSQADPAHRRAAFPRFHLGRQAEHQPPQPRAGAGDAGA